MFYFDLSVVRIRGILHVWQENTMIYQTNKIGKCLRTRFLSYFSAPSVYKSRILNRMIK